jgi:hypothetical protein
MAKGEQRSNREKKKPKADAKGKTKTPPPVFVAPPLSQERGKKKF